MSASEDARKQLGAAIEEVAREMAAHGLWDLPRPPDDAWLSRQPFFVDTMTFPQWLRFVMLARLEGLVDEDEPMPEVCDVAPMAEEYARVEGLAIDSLIVSLRTLDEVVTRSR